MKKLVCVFLMVRRRPGTSQRLCPTFTAVIPSTGHTGKLESWGIGFLIRSLSPHGLLWVTFLLGDGGEREKIALGAISQMSLWSNHTPLCPYTRAVVRTHESFQLQAGLCFRNPREKFICRICCMSFHPMVPGYNSMSCTQ